MTVIMLFVILWNIEFEITVIKTKTSNMKKQKTMPIINFCSCQVSLCQNSILLPLFKLKHTFSLQPFFHTFI